MPRPKTKDPAQRSKFGRHLVTSGVMADLLDMSPNNLASREHDIPPDQVRNKQRIYDMAPTLRLYINLLRQGSQGDNTVAGRKLKLVKEQERKLRLANDETAGITMKSDKALEIVQAVVGIINAGTDALPGRVAQQLSGMTKTSEIRKLLEEELDEIFTMAEGALGSHREALGLGTESESEGAAAHGANGSGTTTKKVSRRVGGRKPRTAKGKR